jgi:dihydrolipoamide dehydrogenase
MQNFDLVVLGGGPGGYPLAVKMAEKGWKVALIDKEIELGGTCLNWGCIPTKALLASAKNFHLLKTADSFGLTAENFSFDWEKVQQRKDQIVAKLRQGVKKLCEKAGVSLFNGYGYLGENKTLTVEGVEEPIKAEKIVLAVGSVPSVPSVFPKNSEIFWTSDQALNIKEIPESLLIVGGGVIGLELGQVMSEFGSKVCVVEMMPQILPGLDKATAKRILPAFKKQGMEILVGTKVEELTENDQKARAIIKGKERVFDRVLLAVGRKVNFSFMQNSEIDIETESGFIKIDNNYQTSIKGVYAIGDAVKGPMLAHKASYDAMNLACHLNENKEVKQDYSLVPSCVYTYPEIAWVGASEEELKENNVEYIVGRSLFNANGKAMTAGENNGQIKTLFNKNQELLGAIIWGPEANNLINEATLMAQFKINAKDFSEVIHPHPTLSEAFHESVENARTSD